MSVTMAAVKYCRRLTLINRFAQLHTAESWIVLRRHRVERSDRAIQRGGAALGLLRFARNDEQIAEPAPLGTTAPGAPPAAPPLCETAAI
jgi:hypothetical protein